MSETIFASATAPGRAAVAVIRLSGVLAKDAVRALAGRLPTPRRASLRTLKTSDGAEIDRALVLWMPGPASYTGEDTAEFHLHGGVGVVGALLETLAARGLRLAEPGEFTRRAFENGKLDLAQAEGVADLIDAETDGQRKQALEQIAGALGQAHQTWRDDLIEALAVLEAAVDFPDEDVPADVAHRARPILERVISQLAAAQTDVIRARRVREGFRVAIIGAPNAGKSTLLNSLAGREAAIVTAIPGTTRDVIEVPMALGGYKVVLADTAGLRDTLDEIEAEGVRRAEAWSQDADLRLWVVDGSGPHGPPPPAALRAGDLCVVNKTDLPAGGDTAATLVGARALELEVHRICAQDSRDLAALEGALTARVVAMLGTSEPTTATRIRHGVLLRDASVRLECAIEAVASPELAAEDVRLAMRALDRITGRIGPEDVLDRIFASFCIGK